MTFKAASLAYSSALRSLTAFKITDTELSVIAALARVSLRFQF
ncbi:MAG TPA: hypothetical protein VNJ04_14565 [Gemmatimonadaceae bacterium]|nr:hypothetical protein [Gemmatimonadaceae bacterium]